MGVFSSDSGVSHGGAWPNAARLLVAVEDLGDAAVGYAQLARDDTGTHSSSGELHNLQSDVVG